MKTDKLESLEKKLGYTFKDNELLMQALCHSSYANEQINSSPGDNERLEFLGDAVLDLAISHILMLRFKDATEGDVSKFRATVVDEAGLYEVALRLGLGECFSRQHTKSYESHKEEYDHRYKDSFNKNHWECTGRIFGFPGHLGRRFNPSIREKEHGHGRKKSANSFG